ESEVEERVERVFVTLIGNFADSLALVLFQRGIGDLEHFDAVPFSLEQMGPLKLLSKRTAKGRVAVECLLLLERLIEHRTPQLHVGEREWIAQIHLHYERLAEPLRDPPARDARR